MFGIGIPEILIIAVIFMIVFGAGKFPDAMSKLGQGLKDFKNSITGGDNDRIE